ncbi:MAG: glycosyltransferase [Bacteroides sp.]|nr:glycosyltransferase [Bacteroides sp.]
MRILHVINDLRIGGAQRLLADLLPLQSEGNEVKLCLLEDVEDPAFLNQIRACGAIDIEILNPGGGKSVGNMFAIFNRLRRLIKEFDIIHVHLFPSLYYAAFASLFVGKRKRGTMIYTEHNSFNMRRNLKWAKWIERMVYSRYSSIICISRATLNNLALWLGLSNRDSRLVQISNGVPVERFNAETSRLRRECGDLQADRLRLFGRSGTPVLMISRFVESKDHPTLLRALREIEDRGIFAVLVGDGPRKDEFERLVRELGIEDRVVMLGSQSDITRIIALSEVGVQSSNWEGFGLTAVEMMAGGLPLIVSDVEGLSGVVDGVALKFRRGDYRELAHLIVKLANPSEERTEMIKAGEAAAWKYDMRVMAEAYMNVYLGKLGGVKSKD